jgi:polyphosphate kinase
MGKKQPIGTTDTFPFINRELSWVEFNRRVLYQALDPQKPLLERLKFISIVSSNFDEFFMVRVATLKRQLRKGNRVRCPSGLSPSKLLSEIETKVREIVTAQHECLENEIFPGLREEGLSYVHANDYSPSQKRLAQEIFDQEIFLTLTPVRVEENKEFPFTNSLYLHLFFKLSPLSARSDEQGPLYSIVQIPPILSRMRWLPQEDNSYAFTFLEDIIVENSNKLFPGYSIEEYLLFRVTRDADLSVDEERDEDFVEAMEEVLVNRQYSLPIRLEMTSHSEHLQNKLVELLGIPEQDIYIVPGHLDLRSITELSDVSDLKNLKFREWKPCWPAELPEDVAIWDVLKRKDVLLHHPYQSFSPIVKLLSNAASDPSVIAIKMTLYRTSGDSPIIKALMKAAENGKQVTAMVELKARFDEEQNINWAYQLERSGVIVIYGIAHLKVHAKALMIIRRETEGIKRYIHMGTGNYNDKTAKLYTDFSLLTTREEIAYETAQFFNAITGYASVPNLQHLVMAPQSLKNKLLNLINRETERSSADTPGYIKAKMNSLSDSDVIRALYKASQSHVNIELNVRGICMLVPGVKGVSENITVVSIVDRFLEHSRIFYFYNSGDEEIYLSSADWMPRNLERRVELMFPVEDPAIRERLKKALSVFLSDNMQSWELISDGSYKRRQSPSEDQPLRAQQWFYESALQSESRTRMSPKRDFTVRRKPPEKRR